MSEIHKNWKQQLKEEGIKYFVLKSEDLIDCLDEQDLFIFDDILRKYNEFREPKPINKYYVVNRDDVSHIKSVKEFFKIINYEPK